MLFRGHDTSYRRPTSRSFIRRIYFRLNSLGSRFHGGLSTGEIPDNMRIMQLGLENMAVIGQELAIRWTDGTESYFQLEFLRRNCPCALCAGEKDILGNVYRGQSKLTSNSFRLKRCTKVGGYGIQPEWMDGHGSGIYSFSYLRSLNSKLS